MVPIDLVQHLNAHAQEAGGLPFIDPSLRQPRRGRVTQRMWRDRAVQSRKPHSSPETLPDGLHRLAIPLHTMISGDAALVPASEMREQARWDGNWRLPFSRFVLPNS